MKSLPSVTLISYDNSASPEKTLIVLQYCASLIQFASVVLVCNRAPYGANGEKIYFVRETGYPAAMIWEVRGIYDYVHTDFALCVTGDGYIVNPSAWRDEWFNYDFIGAPWPRDPNPRHPGKSDFPDRRVGNTGFCLKSRAFLKATRDIGHLFDVNTPSPGNHMGYGGDTFVSQHHRPRLEAMGMKYAPVEVAADFSWEDNIEEFPNGRPDAFGFHNFGLGNKHVPRIV